MRSQFIDRRTRSERAVGVEVCERGFATTVKAADGDAGDADGDAGEEVTRAAR